MRSVVFIVRVYAPLSKDATLIFSLSLMLLLNTCLPFTSYKSTFSLSVELVSIKNWSLAGFGKILNSSCELKVVMPT